MKFFPKLAVDFGSERTHVWQVGQGIVCNLPSILALDVAERKALAFGEDALLMLGKTPDYMEVVRPIEHGVIQDFDLAVQYLSYVLRTVLKSSWWLGAELLMVVPSGITGVEQRALVDVAKAAGSRQTRLIDAPLAAAIGAKIPVADAFGNMVVYCGSGVTEGAVVALGGVVAQKTLRFGGGDITQKIIEYMQKKYNFLIGEQVAEKIKQEMVSALKPKHPVSIPFSGRDGLYGLPKLINVGSEELYEALKDSFNVYVAIISGVLEQTQPELVADIMDRGIVLTGGGALLKDLPKMLSNVVNVAIHVAPDPELCVIKGAGLVMENLGAYERALRG